MIFGPKKDTIWWVAGEGAEGTTWVTTSDGCAFRIGIQMDTDTRTIDMALHEIKRRMTDKKPTNWLRRLRWFHQALSHGGTVDLRFLPLPLRRGWFVQLWNWMVCCWHLSRNPRGESCPCWSEQEWSE